MAHFKNILFPVDFSTRCDAARPVVASWVRRFNAKATLLHTIQIPISSYGGPDGYPIVLDIAAIEAAAAARLERFEIDVPDPKRVVRVGDPAYETIEYARKNDVDLIMMPTHGYGPFRGLLLGSTAAKVLHDAHCPVWTSAHLGEISIEIRNVLCAIEVGAEAPELIRLAQELAKEWNAELRLVHAASADEEVPDLQQDTGLEISVKRGLVSHVVRDAALEYDADLVVTGHGKLHETFGRLRTNTYAIIRDSPCAVLIA